MFDLNTLRLVAMVSFLGFVFTALTLRHLVPNERSLHYWVASTILIALALLLFGLRGTLSDFISIVFANVLMMLGIGYMYVASRSLFGLKLNNRLQWYAAAATFLICVLSHTVTQRVIVTSTLHALFLFGCARVFWSQSNVPLCTARRIAAAIFALGAMLFMYRAINPPTQFILAPYVATLRLTEVAPYLYGILLSMWIPVTLMLIVSTRLQDQRKDALEKAERALGELKASEFRWKFAVEGSGDGVWDWDITSDEMHYSKRWRELLGYAEDDVLPAREELIKRIYPADQEHVKQALHAHLEGTVVTYVVEYRIRCKDESYKWVACRGMVVSRADDGKPLRMIGTYADINSRKAAEAQLRMLSTAIEQSPTSVAITNLDAEIEYVNPRFTIVTGYSLEEAKGKNPRVLQSGHTDKSVYPEMWRKLTSGERWAGEFVNKRKNGDIYYEEAYISPVKDDDGTITHYVAVKLDVTERKRMEEEVRQIALYDVLTGLPNRRLLIDRMTQAMSASRRSGSYGALMFLDLDNFKPLNDAHGHIAGDLLLAEVAKRLKTCVREVDTVARVGGDEFVVILTELDADEATSRTQAMKVAEKIRASLSKPYFVKLGDAESSSVTVAHHCSASIGVTLFIDQKTGQDDVMKRADKAMYQAKVAGRNMVQFYHEGSAAAS